MGKKKCPECQKCLPAWLAAFGDLMSLLLCFFVLLLSMSTMDAKKVSEAIGSLSGALSVLEGGVKTEVSKRRIQQATPIESTDETTETVNRIASAVIEANEMIKKGSGEAITVQEAEEGFVIRLPASLLFKPGSATIENEDALLFLKRIALIIANLPNDLEVSVQGHSDNVPPSAQSMFKDNWELSTARAISVLQELLKANISPDRMHAAGFSEYRPIATNETKEGRKKNRRVELHFFGKKQDDKNTLQKSILDQGQAQ